MNNNQNIIIATGKNAYCNTFEEKRIEIDDTEKYLTHTVRPISFETINLKLISL